MTAGDYRIRVTAAGDSTPVFDSGTVPVAAGADLVIAAVDSTVPGDAPISLLALDGTGAVEILDAETPATVRVVHASPDAPPVDVLVNGEGVFATLEDLAFTDTPPATPRTELPAQDYNVKVVQTGTTEPVVIEDDPSLVAGVEYSVFAVGLVADADSEADDATPIQALVLTDDTRSVATEARLRVLHASPVAGDVDVYLVERGADIADLDPTLSDVAYLEDSGYLPVPAGAYDVLVTAAGEKTVAIGPEPVDLANGDVFTAAARNDESGGLGLILLDDATP